MRKAPVGREAYGVTGSFSEKKYEEQNDRRYLGKIVRRCQDTKVGAALREFLRVCGMADACHELLDAVFLHAKFPFTVTRESQVSRAAFTFTVNHM